MPLAQPRGRVVAYAALQSALQRQPLVAAASSCHQAAGCSGRGRGRARDMIPASSPCVYLYLRQSSRHADFPNPPAYVYAARFAAMKPFDYLLLPMLVLLGHEFPCAEMRISCRVATPRVHCYSSCYLLARYAMMRKQSNSRALPQRGDAG